MPEGAPFQNTGVKWPIEPTSLAASVGLFVLASAIREHEADDRSEEGDRFGALELARRAQYGDRRDDEGDREQLNDSQSNAFALLVLSALAKN